MMAFNDYIKKDILKNKATSNIKIQQIVPSIGLDNVDIYLRDGPFSSDIGNVSLHPSRKNHWIIYINENFFDSCGCAPPKNYLNLS